MKHFIFAFILVAVISLLGIVGFQNIDLLPVQASFQAEKIDSLFNLHFTTIAILFALIIGIMLYSIVVFRKKPGDNTDSVHIEGNTPLEIVWTIVPLGTVIFFSFLGAKVLDDVRRVDPQALEINVVASQWSWRFEYPDYGVISSALVLPVDQQSLLRLSSIDVIHSFWVPEFRVKQDALPGGEEMVRELRITPTMIGDFTVRCAELCGTQHAYMTAPVMVLSSDEFDSWIITKQNSIPEFPVDRGRLWADQYGCLACHSVDGSELVGPTWQGVFGSQEALSDGSSAFVNEEYLFESIRVPALKIVEGYENQMPENIAADLDDEQVQDIIEFIKSLSDQ